MRLAHVDTQPENPYVKMALPNESLVENIQDIARFRPSEHDPLCLILMKHEQTFSRINNELCEIELDGLKREFFIERERQL